MKGIQHTFKFKDDKIDEPEYYLGANLENTIPLDGSQLRSMSFTKYVKSVVQNFEETLEKSEKR